MAIFVSHPAVFRLVAPFETYMHILTVLGRQKTKGKRQYEFKIVSRASPMTVFIAEKYPRFEPASCSVLSRSNPAFGSYFYPRTLHLPRTSNIYTNFSLTVPTVKSSATYIACMCITCSCSECSLCVHDRARPLVSFQVSSVRSLATSVNFRSALVSFCSALVNL